MTNQAWKLIFGVALVAVTSFVWMQYNRENTVSHDVHNNKNNSVAETRPANSRAITPSQDEPSDIAEVEQSFAVDITAMDIEQETLAPLEQEARQYAQATANMGITQMRALQKRRQGTIVRDVSGQLKPPYAEQELCEKNSPCKTIITNTSTGVTVWDGSWADGYLKTGMGVEVVKRN